jgi:NTE family protein
VPQAPHPWGRRRWLAGALAVTGGAAGVLAAGCGADDAADLAPPRAMPLPQPPRTAWVFSSGGPRGFVHVGVAKGLAALGLAPDLVVGASVGALVGVLVAAGRAPAEIEALALGTQPWQWLRPAFGAGHGAWLSGAPIASLVRREARASTLEALRCGMAVVARREGPAGGGVVAFTHGDTGLAVQAACAIEGRIAPVMIDGMPHGDADLHMPLPVRVARALGAVRVLAVDASAHEDRAPPGSEEWREADLRKRTLTRPDAALADVMLHPEFGYWASLSRAYRERCIAAGEAAVMAAAPAILAMHAGR